MPRKDPDSLEAEWVVRATEGDAQAFGLLYDRYLDAIYRYIYYRVADHADAEDLAETVFLKTWEVLPRMQSGRMNFQAWLYRVAHNVVVDHYRTRKPKLPLEPLSNLPADTAPPESDVERHETGKQLARAIARLKPDLQQVIACRFINGFSHAEAAEIMGLKEGHVRVLQHRALKQVRQILTEEGVEYA